jgi:hypothetical protein
MFYSGKHEKQGASCGGDQIENDDKILSNWRLKVKQTVVAL